MEQDLEKYITSHREAFDDQPEPEALWGRIRDGLDAHDQPHRNDLRLSRAGRSRNPWKKALSIAATLILAGMIGISIYFYGHRQGLEDYARIDPELAASRAGYQQLVTQKKDSVLVFVHQNPGLDTEFSEILSNMEANYDVLKKELANSPNQERTLSAMIINLQAQADVLNQQLIILTKLTHAKNEKL